MNVQNAIDAVKSSQDMVDSARKNPVDPQEALDVFLSFEGTEEEYAALRILTMVYTVVTGNPEQILNPT